MNIQTISNWCKEHTQHKWECKYVYGIVTIYFTDETDALIFYHKWY